MTPLRRQMIDDVTARGLAKSTQASYLHAVTSLGRYHRKNPDRCSGSQSSGAVLDFIADSGSDYLRLSNVTGSRSVRPSSDYVQRARIVATGLKGVRLRPPGKRTFFW